MQSSRLPLRVAAIVIVNTIGDVGMFLDLAEDQSRSNRVRCAGGNKNCLSCMHRNVLQTILRRTFGYRAAELLQIHAVLQSHHHFGAFAGSHRIPHLCLAAAPGRLLVPRGIIIIRMNLHGKLIFHKQKFHEERERTVFAFRRSLPCGRHFSPGVSEFFARIGTRRENAVVARQPSFAKRFR